MGEEQKKTPGNARRFFVRRPANDIRAVLALTLRAGALHR